MSLSRKIRYYLETHRQILIVPICYALLYILFFSPVIFSGNLLGPGDGWRYNLPNFYPKRALWDPLIFSGYPHAADCQAMTWHPLSFLFSLFPNSWNSFVILAYILASSFMYAFIYSLTKSRFASLVSGTIYGMSGFMMWHLGHTNIIHTAAWMPLTILAFEKIRSKIASGWFVIAILSVVLSILGGHPQITFYSLTLASVYVCFWGWSAPIGRWKYYGICLLIMALGVSLAGIQIIPTMELAYNSLRSEIDFKTFDSYSLPVWQSINFLFPWFFGGGEFSFNRIPYFGALSINELSGYFGLLTLMLVSVAIMSYRKNLIIWYWVGIAVFAFILTLGNATPLAQFIYHLPLFNKFRAPARHNLEMTFAVSVLAGLGITALRTQKISSRAILKILLALTSILLIIVIAVFAFSNPLQGLKKDNYSYQTELLSWSNPALGIPLAIYLLSIIMLFLFSRNAHSYFRQTLLFLILVIDLGSCSWFTYWKFDPPSQQITVTSPSSNRYKLILNATHQRMIFINPVYVLPYHDFLPNVTRLYGLPNASGINPMVLSRMSSLLSFTPDGSITRIGEYSKHNRSLDILAIRSIFMPRYVRDNYISIGKKESISWQWQDLNITIGSKCSGPHPKSYSLDLVEPISTSSIAVVSQLGCSPAIMDNTEIMRIMLTDTNGRVQTLAFRAGLNTSEWAYDCKDVHPHMKHRKASIYSTFPIIDKSVEVCKGHSYVTVVHLEKLSELKRIEFQWLSSIGTISIRKISLLNEQTGQSYPIPLWQMLASEMQWRRTDEIGIINVFENVHAMPRVWLVPEVVYLREPQILTAIQTSIMPDRRIFDPLKTALIEEPLELSTNNIDKNATAQILNIDNNSVTIHANSSMPSFLVLSDIYYPGWAATIDGVATHIYQTNYILRGIMLPPGDHFVQFNFRPRTFFYGAYLSIASLIITAIMAVILKVRLRHNNETKSVSLL